MFHHESTHLDVDRCSPVETNLAARTTPKPGPCWRKSRG